MNEKYIKEKERIDDLGLKNLKIIQDDEGFCFGIDSVLLSDFAKNIKKNAKVLDLGTGTGIIGILLCGKTQLSKVIGVEIQRDIMFCTEPDELSGMVPEPAVGRSAEFEMRKAFFQFRCSDGIELIELLQCSVPHEMETVAVGAFRLVPDFPVADVESEAVRPALRVVTDDVRDNFDPLARFRRIKKIFMDSVFDGGSQTIINGGSKLNTVFEIIVGLFEIVVAGIIGISVEVGKDQGNVDQARSRVLQRCVVKTRDWQMQFSELLPDVPARFFIDDHRGQISSVDLFDSPDSFSAEHLNGCFHDRSFSVSMRCD